MKIGDRVAMTQEAQRSFSRYRSKTGVVVGLLPYRWARLRVHRDGIKQAETWHESYWRKVRTPKG